MHGAASKNLAILETLGRLSTLDPRQVAQVLSSMQAALGQLYGEVAEDAVKAGDVKRAVRLLRVAEKIDPGNAGRHKKRRLALEQEAAR